MVFELDDLNCEAFVLLEGGHGEHAFQEGVVVLGDRDRNGVGAGVIDLKLAVDEPFILNLAVSGLPTEGHRIELDLQLQSSSFLLVEYICEIGVDY